MNIVYFSPRDDLMFNVTDGTQDITQFINLTNTSDTYLAYKVFEYKFTLFENM